MYKLGLKLWSVNTDKYFDEIRLLHEEGMIDYIELYIIPDSCDSIQWWKLLNIPYTIHAPHFAHGFNLAVARKEPYNSYIYAQVKEFADALNADYIIFHGGNRGSLESTVRQLASFNETRAVIENKPYHTLKDHMRCHGATPDEIGFVKDVVSCMFCLDLGHAVCSANSQGLSPYSYIYSFMKQDPVMFHISGVADMSSPNDTHLSLSEGQLAPKKIAKLLPQDAKITIETPKNNDDNLNDFREDVRWMLSL